MKKWHAGILFTGIVFIVMGAKTSNSTLPGGDEHKNLKILPKDISDKQLHKIMEEYAVSLGVHCNFCHARNSDSTIKKLDFASDAKEEKKTARNMMEMTAYLNKNYFKDTIPTIMCYTCHRGHKEPSGENTGAQLDSIIVNLEKMRGK